MKAHATRTVNGSSHGILDAVRFGSDRLRRWLGGSYVPYLFISPFFVFFFAFGLYPLWYAFRLSFTNWRGIGDPNFIGLDNYTFLLQNSFFWSSILNSAILWLLIVPAQVFLSILGASLLTRPRPLQTFFRVAFLIPYLVPLVAVAQVWLIMFDRDFGAVNSVLQTLGLPAIGWLTTDTWSKPTIALLVFWKGFGFSILIMLAAIQSIPPDVYEAAALDGATGFQQFRQITVPLMLRTIVFFMVISTLAVLQLFAEPYVLTGGGPYNSSTTAGFALYRYIQNLDLGTGAAHSFLLMIIMTIISLLMLRFLRARHEA